MRRSLIAQWLVLLAAPMTLGAQGVQPKSVKITDVTVIDGTGAAPQPHMTVILRAGRVADLLAEASQEAPHSYQVIRARSGLKLTDEQFHALIRENPDRFVSVQFAKKDKAGNPIKPGRPGVRLIRT